MSSRYRKCSALQHHDFPGALAEFQNLSMTLEKGIEVRSVISDNVPPEWLAGQDMHLALAMPACSVGYYFFHLGSTAKRGSLRLN